VRVRAALLPRTGAALEVTEVELAPPQAGEVLVRLHVSGVCHSDLNAIDGTAETRCPAVLGHEGAGVVEAVGPGVGLAIGTRVALSWMPSCGSCEECLRELPHLCRTAWSAMSHGGLPEGTPRLSRDGEPVYHYSLLSTFAERAVVAARSCIPIPADVPFDVAALLGCAITTGVGAVWNTGDVRAGDRVCVIGCGGVGLSAVMGAAAADAEPVVAVDVNEAKLATALVLGATDTVLWAGTPEATAEAVRELSGGGVDLAIEAIPRADAEVSFPAVSIPRLERRVLGSIYGSSRPEHDFARIIELYRADYLPLDRLISHRFPLEGVNEAFDLMRSGDTIRAVLELDATGHPQDGSAVQAKPVGDQLDVYRTSRPEAGGH